MNGKMKMIVGIALALGVLSIAFLATPIQAYVNGNANGDLLQTQDQDRIRTQDCDGDCTQKQYHSRQRTNECATNRICNCTISMERYRHRYRERTRMQG